MALSSSQDVFYFVGAICIVWITVFLCWALYQVGKLIHQANDVVTHTREKVDQIEKLVTGLSRSVGFLASGGKAVASFLKKKKGKKKDDL